MKLDKYYVRFSHLTSLSLTEKQQLNIKLKMGIIDISKIKVITLCKMFVGEDMLKTVGYSTTHESDEFSKSTGRKNSLTRAMVQITDKTERTKIWKDYLNIK